MRVILTYIICITSILAWAKANNQPTSAPAGADDRDNYPPAELVDKCAVKAAQIRNKIAKLGDEGFTTVVHPPFVTVGNMSREKVNAYASQSIKTPAEAMWNSYFKNKPAHPIIVYLFADADSYKTWAKKILDDDEVPYYGYYRSSNRTLVMNIGTGTGTLVHELTHALIAYDFPNVPTWLNEGLASLHEQCSVRKNGITGLVNWRLPALQNAIKNDKLRSLCDLVTKRDFYGRLRGLNYAQARYFVMYMQQRRVLKNFYRHFRDSYDTENANDVEAIEHIFGSDIREIEKKFLKWVASLKYPPESTPTNSN